MIPCIISWFMLPEKISNTIKCIKIKQAGWQQSSKITRRAQASSGHNRVPAAKTKSYQIASKVLRVSSCKSSHWKPLISSGSLRGEHMLPGWLRACPFPATLPLLLLSFYTLFPVFFFFFFLLACSHSHFPWVEREADKENVKTFRLSSHLWQPRRKIIVTAGV